MHWKQTEKLLSEPCVRATFTFQLYKDSFVGLGLWLVIGHLQQSIWLLQLQERWANSSILTVNKSACMTFFFFFSGGCEAPLKSASAASGWSKRSHPYEHDTSTMSNRAGSAELLCTLSKQQSVWNWLDRSLHSLADHLCPWLIILI